MPTTKRPQPLLLNAIDQNGREIDPKVLEAAREIAPRAIARAEKILDDPALSVSILEEIAATVTITIRTKSQRAQPPIEDLQRYLYLAYLRRVRNQARRTPTLQSSGEPDWELHAPASDPIEIERKVLADELLAHYDTVTVEIILRRYGGQTWREIGAACGISATAARLRFRKAILQMHRRITEPKDRNS